MTQLLDASGRFPVARWSRGPGDQKEHRDRPCEQGQEEPGPCRTISCPCEAGGEKCNAEPNCRDGGLFSGHPHHRTRGTLTFVTRLLRGQGVSVLGSVDVVRHLGRATWRVVTVRDHEERGSVSRARRHRAVGSTACAHPVLTVRVRQQAHGEVTGPGAQPEVRPGVRSDPTDGISVEFLEGVLGEVRR